MGRPKSAAVAVRNDQIYALWKGGKSLTWLAQKYERTPQQVGRIVAAFHPDLEDDDDRALHRGRLETLYEEVQAVVDAPGVKLAPNGRPAEGADGEPLEDVGAKIEALKLKLMVLESTRKLDARDRPQKSHVTHELAQQQASTYLAEVREKIAADNREKEELRRAAVAGGPVIQGAIEPPAAGG